MTYYFSTCFHAVFTIIIFITNYREYTIKIYLKNQCKNKGYSACVNWLVSFSSQRHNFSNTCIDFSRSTPACGIPNR